MFAGFGAAAWAVADGPARAPRPRRRPLPELVALPLAVALHVAAHAWAYDPYYLPTPRRYGDGGIVSASGVVAICVFATACAAGLAVRRLRRPAIVATGLLMLVAALAASGAGH